MSAKRYLATKEKIEKSLLKIAGNSSLSLEEQRDAVREASQYVMGTIGVRPSVLRQMRREEFGK